MSTIALAASLPWLELGRKPPLSMEHFRFSCSGMMQTVEFEDLERLLQGDLGPYATSFGHSWAALEIQIRNECARKRESGLKTGFWMHQGYSIQAARYVMEAFQQETPMKREWLLDKGRFALLEELIGLDHLGLERILSFAGQLRLVHRWDAFDEERGRKRFQDLVDRTVEAAWRKG
ncbi:MAG: DUF2764 domain-containing protein [Desulfohalobiaceae bacterium]|nr:DUF2764 domain-containing protein [Desulfohalobiaceae bacterium]